MSGVVESGNLWHNKSALRSLIKSTEKHVTEELFVNIHTSHLSQISFLPDLVSQVELTQVHTRVAFRHTLEYGKCFLCDKATLLKC